MRFKSIDYSNNNNNKNFKKNLSICLAADVNAGACRTMDPCTPERGLCYDSGAGATCTCADGYYGQLCQHEMGETLFTAARLILRVPRHQYCTPLLQQLHWLPISERIKYKTAYMCYNAITGSAPSYLSELQRLYSPSRSLRSSSDTRMLKIQRFNRKTHGFRTFSHFGPHIWNNLP